jgi:hypothetical protein
MIGIRETESPDRGDLAETFLLNPVASRLSLRALGFLLFFGGSVLARPVHHHESDDATNGVVFKTAGLQFLIPAKWTAEPAENSARAGQWLVAAPSAQPASSAAAGAPTAADEGEVVVFYFGPGTGGTAQENIEAWRGTIHDAAGHPVAGEVKTRLAGGFKVTELVAFGAYDDPVPMAGMPPVVRAGYGLAGAVLEEPQGNIYWRLTGPAPLVTATLPLFRKMIDGVKPPGAG